tara:strand:+ start:4196 stop:4432 length:237 start_codon:yes stop_codon:yes gene_type:complete
MSKSTFVCIDAHTCGNPVRVIKDGAPVLKGESMSEKRQHFLREFDWIRKGFLNIKNNVIIVRMIFNDLFLKNEKILFF